MSIVAAVTVAVPTLLQSVSGLDFTDLRFVLALLVGVITVCVGIWNTNRGTIEVIDPAHLHDEYLDLPDGEFKRRMIYWAGKDFDANTRSVEGKAKLLDGLSVAFILQVALFTWWLVW